MAVEDSYAAMVNVSALLTSVMGLKSVLMAVMKPVSFKPSLHSQCVVCFQYIQFLCIYVPNKSICNQPDIGFCEAELALTTHQYKCTNTLYVNTVVHLPEVLKV